MRQIRRDSRLYKWAYLTGDTFEVGFGRMRRIDSTNTCKLWARAIFVIPFQLVLLVILFPIIGFVFLVDKIIEYTKRYCEDVEFVNVDGQQQSADASEEQQSDDS